MSHCTLNMWLICRFLFTVLMVYPHLFLCVYRKAWFAIDLGVWILPTCYTLRHARGYGRSALRNWLLQVSKDSQTWLTLFSHSDDTSLNEPGYVLLGLRYWQGSGLAIHTSRVWVLAGQHCVVALGKLHAVHLCVSVTKQYNLVVSEWSLLLGK